jgi:hypothetical protein
MAPGYAGAGAGACALTIDDRLARLDRDALAWAERRELRRPVVDEERRARRDAIHATVVEHDHARLRIDTNHGPRVDGLRGRRGGGCQRERGDEECDARSHRHLLLARDAQRFPKGSKRAASDR